MINETTIKTPAAITQQWYAHPSCAEAASVVTDGMTVREALAALRAVGRHAFGDMGEASWELSDGSILHVSLQNASDGGQLMSSQRIARHRGLAGPLVRRYHW